MKTDPNSHSGPKVFLAVAGKFHAFNLAREYATAGRLGGLYTATRFFKAPAGVPTGAYHNRLDLALWQLLGSRLPFMGYEHARKKDIFDAWLTHKLAGQPPGVLHGWNGSVLNTFRRLRHQGWLRCVERSCPHNQFQYDLLKEEGDFLGIPHVENMASLQDAIEELHEADVIICPSKYSARSYKDPELIRKLRINPLGGNFIFREKVSKAESLKILMVGNAFLRKGVHYLVEAFKQIVEPDAELWIRGDVPAVYRRRITDSRIKIIEAVTPASLEKLYSSATVFVLPSIDEGFGMVVLEALAYGLPVVVTDNVGAADVLQPTLGKVVPIRNPAALALAIQEVRALPGRDFDEARKRLLARWSWSACATRMLTEVYC